MSDASNQEKREKIEEFVKASQRMVDYLQADSEDEDEDTTDEE